MSAQHGPAGGREGGAGATSTGDGTHRVIVVGAGLAGATAALALAQRAPANTQITVVDRRESPALETSYANAGRFCPTSIAMGPPAQTSSTLRALLPTFVKERFPLASCDPGAPHANHQMGIRFTPALVLWGLLSLRSKTWFGRNLGYFDKMDDVKGSERRSDEPLIRPALSQAWMDESQRERLLRAHRLLAKRAQMVTVLDIGCTGVASASVYSAIERVRGTLWLFRDEKNFAMGREKAKAARDVGFAGCRVVNAVDGPNEFPFLKYWKRSTTGEGSSVKGSVTLPGAVYVGDDHSADARKFTLEVVSAAQSLGVDFQFGLDVSHISYSKDKKGRQKEQVTADGVVLSSGEVLRADAVVLACASTRMAPSGPVRMPIEPLRGFSIDLFGVTHAEGVPQTAFADYSSGDLNYQFTPFLEKGRVRIVGFADFVGMNYADDSRAVSEDKARATRALVEHTRYVMPGLKWESQTPTWFGLRPMTPDNMVRKFGSPNVSADLLSDPHKHFSPLIFT